MNKIAQGRIDEGTKKGIFFTMGVLLNVISILNFNQYSVPALVGIFVGIFLIIKSLS